MPRPTLGLIMIVRDEQDNIPRSLAPVAREFDEVVVVDTGSRDGTVEMCRQLGARVVEIPWQDDFSAARNRAIEEARAQWLVWLDADNALNPHDVARLRALLPDSPAVLWAQEEVVPSGERLWQKRCFPRVEGVRFNGRVHEQLIHPPHWPSIFTPVLIRHWGYTDPQKMKQKGEYYLKLLLKTLEENPEDGYARFQAGRCLSNLGRWEEALREFEKAADSSLRGLNPGIWLHSWIEKARLLERLGRGQEAVAVLRDLVAQAPDQALAHYELARRLAMGEEWDEAASHLQQALDLGFSPGVVETNPAHLEAVAHYYLGLALGRRGKHSRALSHLVRSVEAEPANRGLRLMVARAMIELGARAQARALLKAGGETEDPAFKRLLKQCGEAA